MMIRPEDLQIIKPDKALENKINSVKIKEKILFKKQSDFHEIKVVENSFGRFIKFKDTYQAGVINSSCYKGNVPYINYFLIPYLMNKNIEKILFIGLGTGLILQQYNELFEKLKRIDTVDIEEYIFPIAQKYFDFEINEKMNFYLQDALVFLKNSKTKYDLIVVDVAGDYGIDERFLSDEYLNLISKNLKKTGIFVSNLPSSRDIFNPKNKLILNLIEKYKNYFKNIDIYSGETSNKIYYKVFFDIDKPVFDITNLILISSNKKYKISDDLSKIDFVDMKPYLNDLID